MESSCLMLMMSLYTAVDLDYVIDPDDLASDGIETNPHITVFYSNENTVRTDNILSDAREFLGPNSFQEFLEFLKAPKVFPLYDILGLDKFENQEFDVLIMRLRSGNRLAELLGKLNAGFLKKYSLQSDYSTYRPHMTLSYLKPGMADKYLSSPVLGKVLEDAKVSYDDLMASKKDPDTDKYIEKYITNYNCIERHLWRQKLERNKLLLK